MRVQNALDLALLLRGQVELPVEAIDDAMCRELATKKLMTVNEEKMIARHADQRSDDESREHQQRGSRARTSRRH